MGSKDEDDHWRRQFDLTCTGIWCSLRLVPMKRYQLVASEYFHYIFGLSCFYISTSPHFYISAFLHFCIFTFWHFYISAFSTQVTVGCTLGVPTRLATDQVYMVCKVKYINFVYIPNLSYTCLYAVHTMYCTLCSIQTQTTAVVI